MRLSDFITDHSDEILDEWEASARAAAAEMSPSAVRDDGQQMLRAIALGLERERTADEQDDTSEGPMERPARSAATTRGEVREATGFILLHLVAEYRALRASVLRLWQQRLEPLTKPAMDDLLHFNGAFDIALAESIARYSEPTLARVLKKTEAELSSASLERERAEDELFQSERRFRALIAASSDVLYRMSPDWSEMRQLYSQGFIANTEAPSRDWLETYIPADEQLRLMGAVDEAIRTKSIFELEHRVLRADGSLGWTSSRAVPILEANGEVIEWFGAASDITERKRAEEALHAARADAERASLAKDHFLAVLSHELRTPLTPVLNAAEFLERRAGLSPESREPLEIIRRNVQLQARLIDDLLDLTRIAKGKLELMRKPINICTVITRAVEIARPDIEARRLHFAVTLKDAPHRVDADASRLQQVVWNLLNNAVKFTPEGGCVGLRCERVGGHVVIEVSDSGIGIEPEASERIFDAFEQGERSITRQFGGLGLGLAIAKRLVEMHDGTISVHSQGRNKGATFRVQLPLSTEPLEALAARSAPASEGRSRRILLVEDNGDTAATMLMLLEEYGYEVETAGDVGQAMRAIDSANFDLLISDLGLPDRSGIELMQELRQRGHVLKGIALSGYGQQEDLRRSKEAGFSAHLIKPVDVDLLMETIAALE